MTTQRPLGAQISHMLKARGVDVIFGIPGVHNQEMYRGIEEAGITHVLARHEQGAGFMADGYARASGRPGVAYVITGPGLCNAMTAIGQAYSDSVPMLVIASCLDDVAATRGQLHQMLDQQGAGATVSDWSQTAHSADAAYRLIDRAWLEFAAERPRPKVLNVPIARAEAVAPPPPAPAAVPDGPPFRRPGVQDRLAAQAARALMQAERPLVVFGGGAQGCRDIARELLEKTGAASFVSYAGRGVVAPEAPLHMGSYLARPSSTAVLAQADLVMVVGCELSETDLWRSDLGHDCPLIRVDIDAEVLAHPRADIALCGDAGAALRAICRHLPEGAMPVPGRAAPWTAREVAQAKAKWRAEVDSERPGILRVTDALKAALPEDCMIYSDMTQFAYAAKEVWDMDRPGHWHHPTGFGTLGYALPAAIGGAVARDGRPTLAIAGDYGLQYTIQELGTAVELGLPLPVFVWDNTKLGEIEDSMVRAQIAPNAVTLRNPDFTALARAWGAHAAAPASLAEMSEAVSAAFVADGPTLIHVTPDIA